MKPTILMFLALFSSLAFAAGGVTIRGGGSEVGLEFTDAFNAAVEEIHRSFPDLKKQVDDALAQVGTINILLSTAPLTVNVDGKEQECVAINESPANNIWVYEKRWNKIRHPRVRQAIALHEVLSLAQVERTGYYPVSGAYLAKFHLRNDLVVFVSGGDPDMPSWKTRRTTCETTMDGAKSTSFSTDLVWSLDETFYFLTYVFGNRRTVNDIIELFQLKGKRVWTKGNLTLSSIQESRAAGQRLQRKGNRTEGLTEDLGDGHAFTYESHNGVKGRKLSESRKSTLADGSELSQSEYFVAGAGKKSDFKDCITTEIPGEQWLALIGRPEMGLEIENLNRLALLFYDADRAVKTCTEKCDSANTSRAERLKIFNSAWDRVFEAAAKRKL